MDKKANRVAIITGAASGIGKAIAFRFAQDGIIINIADKDIEAAETTAKEIIDAGGRANPLEVDVTEARDVENVVNQVIEKYGKIDILVNNAGISWSKKVLDLSNDDWDLMIRTHLYGCFYFSKTVAKDMVQRGEGGKILNISSVSGIVGSVGRGPYGAAKGGMITFTRIMAVELAEYGVNVNAIAPGPILTPLMERLWDNVKDYPKDVPMKRFGKPEEVAEAAYFLCSDLADYITGVVLPVDGGFSIAGKMDRTMPPE